MDAISVDDLRRSFGSQPALDGVTFAIHPGEVVGYLGPNGAGKSTTLKVLAGIIAPGSGTATVAGFDVRRDPIEVKRRIGYVPESGAVYEGMTPLEFLRLGADLHGMEPDAAAESIESWLGRFGLLDRIHQTMGGFSKGMKQKVVLASALLHDPPVLLLDEPLTGLDPEATIVLKDILRERASRGGAVFYSSHLLDVVERLAGRVIILHRGRVVLDDSLEGALARSNDRSLEEVFRALTSGGAAT